MPNHMKFCGCQQCRKGMHTKAGSVEVKRKVRGARRKAKVTIKQGKEPDKTVAAGYTD